MVAVEQKVKLTKEDYANISGILWLFWALTPRQRRGFWGDKSEEIERLAYACGNIAGLPCRNDPYGAGGG